MSGRAALRHDRPVVARSPRRVLVLGAREQGRIAPRVDRGAEQTARAVGRSRWRQRRRVEARRALSVRLDRLDDRRIIREQRVRRGVADLRRRAGAPALVRDVRERPPHAVHEQKAVERLPLRRTLAEQPELERELGGRHRGDVRVHAVRVGARRAHGHAGVADSRRERFGRAREAEVAHLAIEPQRRRAADLRDPPARGERLHVELEQPVARDDVAERAVRVLLAAREDVRHRALVVHDLHRRTESGD